MYPMVGSKLGRSRSSIKRLPAIPLIPMNGLNFWFESDSIPVTTPVGTAITSLPNKAPGGSPAIASSTGATVSSTVLNGLRLLNFNGTAAGRYNASTIPSNSVGWTNFFVGNQTPSGVFLDTIGGATNAIAMRINSSNKLELLDSNVAVIANSGPALTPGSWYQWNVTYAAGSGAFQLRQAKTTVQTGASARSITAPSSALFYNAITSNEDYNGNVALLMSYNRVLTAAEIAQVEQYITNKWGV